MLGKHLLITWKFIDLRVLVGKDIHLSFAIFNHTEMISNYIDSCHNDYHIMAYSKMTNRPDSLDLTFLFNVMLEYNINILYTITYSIIAI